MSSSLPTREAVESDGQRTLDFLIIGAQKAGTTSLWQYLRPHPRLYLPSMKEAAFFFVSGSPDELAQFSRKLFAEAPADALLGKVTPNYMIGESDIDVETVAKRIASTAPDVRLIALLRDPIERAVSNYTMAFRRRQEKRSLDAALSELDPEELAGARRRPSPTNSYIVAGEYGRTLEIYRTFFSAEQLLVVFTEDLARDPGVVLDSVLCFLGQSAGFRPEGLGERHFRSGSRKLLDPEAERLLFKYFREEILPHMRGSPRVHGAAFEFFYMTWNVVPDDHPPVVSKAVRARLEDHFRMDAERLAELGIEAPWLRRWEEARG